MKTKAVFLNHEKIGTAATWDDVAVRIIDHAVKLYGAELNEGQNWVCLRAQCGDRLAQDLTGNPAAFVDALLLTKQNSVETDKAFTVTIVQAAR